MKAEPGLYPGVHDDEYRGLSAVSKSDLDAWVRGEPLADRRSLIVGRALHAVMGDPTRAGEMFATCDVELDLRTAQGKSELERIEAESGKTILRPSEREIVAKMVKALRSHTTIRRFIDCPGDHEVVAVAELFPGIMSKGLIDKRCEGKRVFILDWKTTHHPDETAFLDAVWQYGYANQGAYYCDLVNAVTGDFPRFFFCCVSKSTQQAWVTELRPEWYRAGRKWCQDMLALYARFGNHAPAGLEESTDAAQRIAGKPGPGTRKGAGKNRARAEECG